MRKKILAVFAAAFAAALAFAMTGCAPDMRFVTGGESGTYYAFGSVISQYCSNNTDVSVGALSSEGSMANVQALQDGDTELAFCQSDVMAYAYDGTNLFEASGKVDNFSTVAALYMESVQIVTCNPDIKSVEDLKGKTISVGAANSGSYFNAVDILGIYGIDINDDIHAVYQSFGDSTESLKDGKIDAAFVVAGAPTTSITDLSTSKQAYLVSMDEEHIAKLLEKSDYYTENTIAAGTYDGMDEDTHTVAVAAVVLAADKIPDEQIYTFVDELFIGANDEAQSQAHAKYESIDLDFASSITSVPYHPGAAKYYEEKGITVDVKDVSKARAEAAEEAGE